jgi:hypothetical protein
MRNRALNRIGAAICGDLVGTSPDPNGRDAKIVVRRRVVLAERLSLTHPQPIDPFEKA